MSTSLYVLLALLGFGFVIAIHELGHFLFAKWAGVRVEVFSIGFGPRLLTWKRGETEYSLSLLPFGGYVKMTGQEDLPQQPDQPTPPADPRSYLSATPAWKALILLGGVLFNLISSYILLIILAFYGMPILRPVVGSVADTIVSVDRQEVPSPAAQAGLRPGDDIIAIDGVRVRSFEDVVATTIAAGTAPLTLTVRRDDRVIDLPPVAPVYDLAAGRPGLGIAFGHSTRVNFAGPGPLAEGDRPKAIHGVDLPPSITGQEITQRLMPSYGAPVPVTLQDGRQLTVTYGGMDGGLDGTLGFPARIAFIQPGSAAADAGLAPGDCLLAVDGVTVCGSQHAYALILGTLSRQESLTLRLQRRDGTDATVVLTGRETAGRRRIGAGFETAILGPVGILVPAIDGQPAAATVAGLTPDHSIVALEDQDHRDPRIQAWTVTGGSLTTLPLSAADETLLRAGHTPNRLARLLGDTPRTSLIEDLRGVRVVATRGADGSLGTPSPGLLQAVTASGNARTIDLGRLGTAGTTLLTALQPGDWILGLGRDGDNHPALHVVRGAGDQAHEVILPGRLPGQALAFDDIEKVPYRLESPGEAFSMANHAAHTMIVKSATFLVRFFQPPESGGIDASKSLQGPIGIFRELKVRAERFGLDSYLQMVALIGLNLVLVNLLPIPITDGGQLVFLAIETAIKRPLPEMVRTILGWMGLALVVGLMLFATVLDIGRLL